ncbi:MAG: dipeptide epimerase [Candidatus Schekmanbacteria bacterium]|nr:dipeptide epimerase [Candidatus Schekmanbacteria bacterium]
MQISSTFFDVTKRVALTTSRATTAGSTNLWVRVADEGVEGWGEAVPIYLHGGGLNASELGLALERATRWLACESPWRRDAIAARLLREQTPAPARAALDIALHDWLGKRLNQPLWRLWGLSAEAMPPTSVTIGIAVPDVARQRARQWLTSTDARLFKVKLGSPEGAAADRALFSAVRNELPEGFEMYADANGGWTLPTAVAMVRWLAEQGALFIEQPLPEGDEAQLAVLRSETSLPIFADESCRCSRDVAALAGIVDGVNIKLMKCGGLAEAARMVQVARAHGMRVMLGCFGETSLAISAAAQLAPLVDYADLDSHLNLRDDPFGGVELRDGRLRLQDHPGIGVRRLAS